jgi:hypothetical protein
MTAEELFGKHFNGLYYDDITSEMIEDYAKEFAKVKCEELLEIVAEKVELMETYYNWTSNTYVTKRLEEKEFRNGNDVMFIDKDSIFNAVDLDEFIV